MLDVLEWQPTPDITGEGKRPETPVKSQESVIYSGKFYFYHYIYDLSPNSCIWPGGYCLLYVGGKAPYVIQMGDGNNRIPILAQFSDPMFPVATYCLFQNSTEDVKHLKIISGWCMKKQNFSCRNIFKVWSAHHENLEDIFFFEERRFNVWISELCPIDPKL